MTRRPQLLDQNVLIPTIRGSQLTRRPLLRTIITPSRRDRPTPTRLQPALPLTQVAWTIHVMHLSLKGGHGHRRSELDDNCDWVCHTLVPR